MVTIKTQHIKKHIQQKENGCGHACIAMILNTSLEYIENIVGYSTALNTKDVKIILKLFGFKSIEIKWYPPILPCYAILIINGDNDSYHAMILDGEDIIDPNRPNEFLNLNWLEDNDYSIAGHILLLR
jgi:hypothetical protein